MYKFVKNIFYIILYFYFIIFLHYIIISEEREAYIRLVTIDTRNVFAGIQNGIYGDVIFFCRHAFFPVGFYARVYFANRTRGNRNVAQRADRIRDMHSCIYIAHLDADAFATQRPPRNQKASIKRYSRVLIGRAGHA